ncbi:MAG TPA: hypothetical protein VFU43_30695 [Streptosporangiaceae bacterium]|nr:hypothetical protein [Streptosporangiaceae bacterium]
MGRSQLLTAAEIVGVAGGRALLTADDICPVVTRIYTPSGPHSQRPKPGGCRSAMATPSLDR